MTELKSQTAIKALESARNELVTRIQLRDGALLGYIIAIVTLSGFAIGTSKATQNLDLLITIPFVSLGYAIIISQHNSVIATLIEYLHSDLRPTMHLSNSYAIQFISSEAFSNHTHSSNWERTISHASVIMIPAIPSLWIAGRSLHWSLVLTGVLATILALGFIFRVHWKRSRVNKLINYDRRPPFRIPVQMLKNSYTLLRHGESEANLADEIASTITNAGNTYGLTPEGKRKVFSNIGDAIVQGTFLSPVSIRIYCSPLLRTVETANIAKEILKSVPPIGIEKSLIERNFGDLELTSSQNYKIVWRHDKKDPYGNYKNTESIFEVFNRASKFILNCEENFKNEEILVVSHGDVISALICFFEGKDLRKHRLFGDLKTAEICSYRTSRIEPSQS